MSQSITPLDFISLPSKEKLAPAFNGKPVATVRTPALVIDRAVFAKNCARMHETAAQWGAGFRAHLKTHKTAEGTKLQLISTAGRTDAVVVSTLMEAWQVVRSGLVAEGVVRDILYGLPVGVDRIEDLSNLSDEVGKHGAVLRLIVDHPDQLSALEKFEAQREQPRRWSVFVKVDCGEKRAGIVLSSPLSEPFVRRLIGSPRISLYGFYCHGGNSYSSTSLGQASQFLSNEVSSANTAAGIALEILSTAPNAGQHASQLTISVGSTPTAHAASSETRTRLEGLLHGRLELHAGNYPMLDLQQLHTSLIQRERIAQYVLATVISYYPGRGQGGGDEAVCDAGAIAMSKDTGPSGGFGEVLDKTWKLGRVSQEHGVLVRSNTSLTAAGKQADQNDGNDVLNIGERIRIVGQHACLIAAAHPWYYVVDSDVDASCDKVVDVWVPWKGW